MQNEKKNWLLGIIMSIVPVVVFLLGNLIISSIVQLFYVPGIMAKALGDGGGMEKLQDSVWLTEQLMNSSYVAVASLASDLLISVGIFFWWRAVRKPEVQVKNAFTGKKFVFLVFTGIAIQVTLNVIMALVFFILPESVSEDYQMLSGELTGDGSTSLAMALTVVVAAPIAEDLLMRGLALNYGRKYMNDTAAVIITSVAFGCMHFTNAQLAPLSGVIIQVVYATAIGVVLAIVAIKFKSVWAAVFVHFIVNGSAQLISLISGNVKNEDIVGYCFYAVGIVAIVGMIIMIKKKMITSPDAPTYGEIEMAKKVAAAAETAE
ncbi:MAG: CPBP family intramembrane metalloprotease [Lachnospiraceae bacterium]|nr:CPBP family intramembrane metalloprotease [Lachnospiraceae bacterium]